MFYAKALCILFITIGLLSVNPVQAQDMWHMEKAESDKSYGAGVYDAFKQLQGKQPTPIIVAVLDNGTDINHKDLKPYIWTNEGEIPNNNKDDDGNGYIDDVHGWNFLGGANGDMGYTALEETRRYQHLADLYPDTTTITEEQRKELRDAKRIYEGMERSRKSEVKSSTWLYKHRNNIFIKGLGHMVLGKKYEKEITMMKVLSDSNYKYNQLHADSLRSVIIGDNPQDTTDIYYGNNHVDAKDPDHGTHTAGIVAGICKQSPDNGSWLKVMPVRCVPQYGDERDKDVANSIHYAVDNGAKVISMSFGKNISPNRGFVAEAIQYAQEHDVLLVHAAGNSARHLDSVIKRNYPNYLIDSTTIATNWLEVGASSKKEKKLVAGFSNYGMHAVDLLAPGVNIYSTIPGDKYEKESGTSMAAPVAAGIAAMLRSYYPELTAAETRQILMETVTTSDRYVKVPGRHKTIGQLWYFSRSGGIINAEKAVVRAEEVTKK